jgi:uncharacterized protein
MNQLSTGRLLVLHLLPGAIATLVYALMAGPAEAAGFPPLAAFLASIAIVIIPFELWVVMRAGGLSAIPYRQPMDARTWLVLVPLLLIIGIVAFGILGVLEPTIRDSVFGWLPEWFRDPLPLDAVGDYPDSSWAIVLVAYFVLNVVFGPAVEELYFRGYLLPRMERFGRWAPLINVVLFSIYHFWSPWAIVSRIAGVGPFAYAVWWKRNIYLGMAVHILLNAIGTASVVAIVMQRL